MQPLSIVDTGRAKDCSNEEGSGVPTDANVRVGSGLAAIKVWRIGRLNWLTEHPFR